MKVSPISNNTFRGAAKICHANSFNEKDMYLPLNAQTTNEVIDSYDEELKYLKEEQNHIAKQRTAAANMLIFLQSKEMQEKIKALPLESRVVAYAECLRLPGGKFDSKYHGHLSIPRLAFFDEKGVYDTPLSQKIREHSKGGSCEILNLPSKDSKVNKKLISDWLDGLVDVYAE